MGDRTLDRRTFVKGIGVAAGAAALFGQAGSAPQVSTRVLDRQFDMDGGVQEALVVFDDIADAERLETLGLREGYHEFEHLDTAWTFLDPEQLGEVASWDSVRRVKKAEELEWLNTQQSRESMNVAAVQAADEAPSYDDDGSPAGYRGGDRHVVVIDSGIDASHPGLDGRVEANYTYVDEPYGARDAMWIDAGPGDTDRLGHGTHCAGITAGDGGGGFNGDYRGMAPGATITGYAVSQYVYLPYVVGAWNHLLGRIRTEPDFDPDVVSNSYGVARGAAYNPNDPVNVASWRAYQEGVLPVWAMGNDSNLGTGNRFAKAPHVLGVAATDDTITTTEGQLDQNRAVAGFSSRGRKYDPDKADEEPTKYVTDRTYYDRETLLGNLGTFHAIQDGSHQVVDTGTFTGSVGPGVNTGPVTGIVGITIEENTSAQYHQLGTFGNVDQVSLTLSLEPEGSWVRMTVYDSDGRKVAVLREEPLKLHDTLTFDVDGGAEYVIELEPENSAVTDYTIEYEQVAKGDGDLADARPVTLFRPGIGTHGAVVTSTVDPHDALGQLGPLYAGVGDGAEGEPLYTALSGTSMACPAAAGIALLVRQAYSQASGGAELSPADTMRILEHTARNRNPTYTNWNVGSGHVHAADAVRVAERLGAGETVDLDTGLDALVSEKSLPETVPPEAPPVTVTAEGRRSDDGDVFTGGQTNSVTVTLDSVGVDIPEDNDATLEGSTARVVESVPEGWTVYEEFSDGDYDPETNTVDFGTVQLSSDGSLEADSVSFTYRAEAPSGVENSGSYTFGPATVDLAASLDGTDEDDETTATFSGTDTAYVFAQSTEL